jgi:hypothetical protein
MNDKPKRGVGLRDIFRKPRGEVEVIAKNIKTGEERVIVIDHNLVVNLARQNMSRLIAGDTNVGGARYVTQMSWGSGGHDPLHPNIPIPPTVNDVALAIELTPPGKKPTTYDFTNATTVRFTSELTESEANGDAISEVGLWTTDNVLFARKTFGMITKSSSFAFIFRWKILF